MNFQRYLIEFDTGTVLHGGDVNVAAKRALQGAISHCCMCGMGDLLHIEDGMNDIRLEIKIGCPYPEKIDLEQVKKALPPYKNVEYEVVEGGLTVRGFNAPVYGKGETIVMVNAAVTVYVDADKVRIEK